MRSMDPIRRINARANTRRLAIDCDGYCALIRALMGAVKRGEGDVSPSYPCGAWSGFTMMDGTRTNGKTKAQGRGLPCLKIQTWATHSFCVSQTWATRRRRCGAPHAHGCGNTISSTLSWS